MGIGLGFGLGVRGRARDRQKARVRARARASPPCVRLLAHEDVDGGGGARAVDAVHLDAVAAHHELQLLLQHHNVEVDLLVLGDQG